MFFSISLYIALAVFGLGLVYRVSSWFRYRIGVEAETIPSHQQETEKQRSTLVIHLEHPSTDYPIAPGIYYPWDEEQEEIYVRYYRVRCWPGCHSGSSVGLHPDKKLDHLPAYMTSSIDNLEDELVQE